MASDFRYSIFYKHFTLTQSVCDRESGSQYFRETVDVIKYGKFAGEFIVPYKIDFPNVWGNTNIVTMPDTTDNYTHVAIYIYIYTCMHNLGLCHS